MAGQILGVQMTQHVWLGRQMTFGHGESGGPVLFRVLGQGVGRPYGYGDGLEPLVVVMAVQVDGQGQFGSF